MIAEFALTPWVFDQESHVSARDDWRFWLGTLANRMFPQPNLSPVLVADLGGWWEEHARNFVDQIDDQRARNYAQRLLTHIAGRLVRRGLEPGTVDPANESWWAQAGCRASTVELIDRLVATVDCHRSLSNNPSALRPISTVEDEAFWQDISVEWSPPATIAAQVKTLRKLAVHGEFVWLATPYAKGYDDDETPFACAVIRDVFRRPRGFNAPTEVELHTELPEKVSVSNHLHSVRQSIWDALAPGQTVRHVVWRKLLERIFLSGHFASTSDGLRPAPRWGVYMGHIARKADARSGALHEWKLLNDQRVSDWFKQLSTRSPPNFVQSDDIKR